ncbi:hypothetical protein DL89DRAFT_18562 [Linderina pennispora]|uniref:Zn(2)-C6 fungal-type domain-containing protein n=1 Tax=Linderina pennispora TaxID=61395 RepID=A0A1Y1WLU8_9FUNG|nr:uncharacterized protein DL89DRAFT_18562 [Linderina pennispora]ORX74540.1 hypothetical protein DL89DRAFT_18562 [Linderina pennispora]
MQNGNQYTDYPAPAGGGTQLPPISTSLGRPPPPRMVAPPPTVKQQHPYSFGFHTSSVTENAQTQPELYTEVPRFYPGPSALHHLHQRQRQQQQLHQPPVKLLQSCDSCRRRKIRCSGEKANVLVVYPVPGGVPLQPAGHAQEKGGQEDQNHQLGHTNREPPDPSTAIAAAATQARRMRAEASSPRRRRRAVGLRPRMARRGAPRHHRCAGKSRGWQAKSIS